MTGFETTAYTIASLALATSVAAHTYASRALRDSRCVIVEYLAAAAAGVALLALCSGLGMRAAAARRWPLGTRFEFTLAFTAATLLVYLVLRTSHSQPVAGTASTSLALFLLLHALYVQPQATHAIQALAPVMRGLWFTLHTLLIAIAYGALSVAAALAMGTIAASSSQLITLADRATGVGYIALSLGMISGGIWGELAWGDYWTWSIKETGTLVIWLTCTLYYHVRHRRGWRGRRATFVIVLILVAVWANFLLSPTFLRWTRLQEWRIY